jgi:hypothetical protein
VTPVRDDKQQHVTNHANLVDYRATLRGRLDEAVAIISNDNDRDGEIVRAVLTAMHDWLISEDDENNQRSWSLAGTVKTYLADIIELKLD